MCCLFGWPPASRLSVLFRLFCVSRLAVGCYLVFAAPPPPFVSRGFRRCLSLLGFLFSLCAPVVSGFFWFPAPDAPGLGAVCCLFPARLVVVSRVLHRPASCRVVLRSVVCFVLCLVLCGVLVWFLRRVVVGLVVLFLFFFAVVRCCVLCWFFSSWSLAFPWCSGLFLFLCSACAVQCRCACGVALCALLSCPCGAGWCFVLLSVVFACLLLGLAVLCCLLLGPGGSWCRVSVVCCGVSLVAVLRRVAACRAAWRCVVVRCVVSFCSAWCCRALSVVLYSCVVGAVFCLVLPRCVCCSCFVLLPGVVLCAVCVLGSCCAFPVLSALCGVAVLLCSPLVPCSPVLCPVVLCCRVVLFCPVLLPCLFGFSYL